MSNYPKNAAPRAIIGGMRDDTAAEPVRQPFKRPIHIALSLIRSSWGPENDQFVSGDFIKKLYGSDIFDRRSPTFTHTNLLAEEINSAANPQMMVRMVPEDAPAPAGLTFWFDSVIDEVPNYERNADQSYKLDAHGDKIVSTVQPTTTGVFYRIFTTELGRDTEDEAAKPELGRQKKKAGELVSAAQVSSEAIPFYELRRPHRGLRGNWGGVRLSPLFTTSRSGVRSDLVETLQAFMFRMAFVERPAANKPPLIKTTLKSAEYVDVSFKKGAYDDLMRRSVDIRDTLIQAHNAKSTDGGPDEFGVFNQHHIYEDNLKAIQEIIFEAEKGQGTLSFNGGEDSLDLVNFLTARSPEDIPYYKVVRKGGLMFSEVSSHYAQGGGDGTLTDATFNASVEKFIDEFETSPMKLWDPFRVPLSSFYDSGFPVATKMKLCRLLALRDDINIYMSPQTYGQPILSEVDEYSIGQALAQEMLSYPESVLWGTQTCRGMILGQGGVRPALNIGDTVVPMITFHFAKQMAHFAGSTNGGLDRDWLPSLSSRNVLKGFTDSNAQSKNDRTIDDYWERGIVYAQYSDRADIFVPAYQSVYEDDTSSFNNALAVFLMTDVIKICRETWVQLTGQQGLSQQSFILKSNTLISKKTADLYQGLLRVRPDTYFTETDTQLAWPWQCRVTCESDPMRTVGLFEVVAARPAEQAA